MIVYTRKVTTFSMLIFLLSSFVVIPLPYFITLLDIKSANFFLAATIGVFIIGSFISTIVFSMINFKKVDNTRKQELDIIKRNICLICGAKIRNQDDYCQNCGNKVT